MELRKEEYKERIIDKKIKKYLKIFGAISIEGPKWCGKTWTALNNAKSAVYLNNTENNFNDRALAKMNVDLVLNKEYPQLIDEWQEVPAIWDGVRFKCDEDKITGKYILTGSSVPATKDIHHSGAGRIAKIKMYTMSLYESGDSTGIVSLEKLFLNDVEDVKNTKVELSYLLYLIARGGWPEVIGKEEFVSMELTKNYIESVLDFDITNIDGVKRDKNRMRMILRSLARNESTIVNNKTIFKDVNEIKNESSENTILDYIDVLEKLNLVENQIAFNVNLRSSSRIGKTAKRHFVDTSLACAILDLNSEKMIKDINFAGFLFESMCERDLRIYIESLGGNLFHFRDNTTGLEIDSIVELQNGDYGAIEIKLGLDKVEEAAKNLLDFYSKVVVKPKFMAIVCGLADAVIRREDGIYIIPITALKD